MNPIKNANLKLLRAQSPQCEGFLRRGPEDTCRLEKTRSGCVTLRYNGKLIHSVFDPVLEGRRFAENQGVTDGNYVVLYGFGLGYHVEGILGKIGPAGVLKIIELNGEILEAACSSRDLGGILADPRVSILIGTEKGAVLKYLDSILKTLSEKNGKLIFHTPSLQAMPSEFKEIENAFELVRMEKRTGARFSSLEEKNYEKNKSIALETPGISALFGKYTGKPGILAGAGPSLDLALPWLSLLSQKVVVFATDTAYPILVDSGAVPKFVVSMDPQYHSLVHFRGYPGHESKLLFSPTSNPGVVKAFKGEKMVFTTPGQKKYFKDRSADFESKGETQEGGSVSCVGLDLMARFGFNPIALIGQDCSFSLNRSYASNSAKDKDWQNSIGALNMDDFHMNSIKSQKVLKADDRFGGKVAAHQNLFSYRGYIEQIAQTNKNTKFYNFHSMGLPIRTVKDIFSMAEICIP